MLHSDQATYNLKSDQEHLTTINPIAGLTFFLITNLALSNCIFSIAHIFFLNMNTL